MRKALWLLAVLGVVGCSSGKKPEQAATAPAAATPAAPAASASVVQTSVAGVTAETKPLIEQATQLIMKRDFGKAFEQLNAAIKADSKCAAAYFMRAGIFADAGQNSRSLNDFNAAIELDQKNADFRNSRGFFFLTRQQYPAAVKDFSAAIKLNPMHAQACNNRGLANVAQGQFKEAVADFTEALKLGPQNFDAYNNRGFAYFQAGDSEKALTDFNSAIRLNPEYLNAYNNRGLLFFKAEKYAEAAGEFTEAIARDKMNAKYYRHRREAYLKAGMADEARVDLVKINWLQELARLNQIATRTPKDAAVWVQRANHLVAGDEFETALKDFGTALKLDEKLAAAHVGLAQLHLKQGKAEQALAECALATKLGAASEVASIQGDIYLKLNKFDEAIGAYENAQRFDAKVAEAYLQRSKERKSKGQAEAADEDFRQAVALDPSLEGARQ
jgi:tetratricopeptide (TPR) repeat protein